MDFLLYTVLVFSLFKILYVFKKVGTFKMELHSAHPGQIFTARHCLKLDLLKVIL